MRLRMYTFRASGTVDDPERAAAVMADSLNRGPDSIVQHVYSSLTYQQDRDTIGKVGFVMEDGKLTAVTVGAYDWLPKDRKDLVRECLQAAADKTGSRIAIDGGMKYAATDENLPGRFYHLTERKALDAILEEGLIPRRGHNDWRSKKKCTYLTEDKYVVPWLGILDNLDGPVVLEVKTDRLSFVEQGRIFNDRDYVPGRVYSEHRTTEAIPPDALRILSPQEVAALGVNERAAAQLMYVAGHKPDRYSVSAGMMVRTGEQEVLLCMDRLREMGVMDGKAYGDAMEAYEARKAAVDYAGFVDGVNAMTAREGMDEGL